MDGWDFDAFRTNVQAARKRMLLHIIDSIHCIEVPGIAADGWRTLNDLPRLWAIPVYEVLEGLLNEPRRDFWSRIPRAWFPVPPPRGLGMELAQIDAAIALQQNRHRTVGQLPEDWKAYLAELILRDNLARNGRQSAADRRLIIPLTYHDMASLPSVTAFRQAGQRGQGPNPAGPRDLSDLLSKLHKLLRNTMQSDSQGGRSTPIGPDFSTVLDARNEAFTRIFDEARNQAGHEIAARGLRFDEPRDREDFQRDVATGVSPRLNSFFWKEPFQPFTPALVRQAVSLYMNSRENWWVFLGLVKDDDTIPGPEEQATPAMGHLIAEVDTYDAVSIEGLVGELMLVLFEPTARLDPDDITGDLTRRIAIALRRTEDEIAPVVRNILQRVKERILKERLVDNEIEE